MARGGQLLDPADRQQLGDACKEFLLELDEILQGRDCSDGDEALLQRALGKAEEVMRMVNARLQEARIQPHELGING